MKVGREPARDRHRLAVARAAIGPDVEFYVDANGAYERREARAWAQTFADAGVTYLEEPVSSDDLDGLRLLRDRAPAGLAIAAGEYAYALEDVARMLAAGAVDVQQVDVTRCGGITELVRAGALCQALGVPLSAHCAPAVSVHACCAVQRLAHLEYFHDHVRIERLLFDGTLEPDGGDLVPDRTAAGHGLTLRRDAAARYATSG
ncbi:D-galactarolactone cycloisomerase [Capillimicrobium parvum]|uniref:D-galactarolactone cycloisomerase n=1 Tax=Capillimicrobium parvum TaxID=2884022 RepID=A0A9E6Y1S3_9ACTN|nr:enolase C-terminal domain-like protein [Capillimicrobium parvum]UGS38335.1 D-galactarolactone cycloisomerase [Capillimicrobium parvum]